MFSDSKLLELISRLTRRTATGETKWHLTEPPGALLRGTDDVIPLYFETRLKDQRIGLAQRRYRDYDGENERLFWNEAVVLLFLDSQSRVVWETSRQGSALVGLFETVRKRSIDVDGMLDHLINDDL